MTTPETFDVIIVGGGGAGLAAAIEARATGRRVVLLEKNPALGGSTSWSIGSVTATNTPHQRKKGILDSPEDHWADMPGFASDLQPRDNDALRRILCEAMPDTFQWLLDKGIRFSGPMPEPPHRRPRMHNVLPNSRSYAYHLGRHARRLGVDIRTGARVATLQRDGGRVVGVTTAEGRDFRARTIVLSAGDFTNGTAFKQRYMGEAAARVEGVNVTATGDGQALGLDAGGRILNGDLALGPELRFIPPARETLVRRLPPWPMLATFMAWALDHLPPAILRPFVLGFVTTALAPSPSLFEEGAILINKDGRRFADERAGPALALAEQRDKVGWIVIDGRIARQFAAWPHFVSTAPGVAYAYVPDYRRNRPDVYAEAATIDALAAKIGVPSDAMAATITERNGGAVLDGRNAPPLPLAEAPFVALGPVRPVFVHSEGGLVVDERHRVLDAEDRPVPGLYAAGSTGQGGLLLKGHGHHLAWAFVSGRRAGRFAAWEATGPDRA